MSKITKLLIKWLIRKLPHVFYMDVIYKNGKSARFSSPTLDPLLNKWSEEVYKNGAASMSIEEVISYDDKEYSLEIRPKEGKMSRVLLNSANQ